MFKNIVVVLPELARKDAIHAFMYGLKPLFKKMCKSIVFCLNRPYAQRYDDDSAETRGKRGILYTEFVLTALDVVPLKNRPHKST